MKIKIVKQSALFLAIFLMAFFQTVLAQTAKPGVFYAISGNGLKDSSFLFGTYHLINGSYIDNKENIRRAFNKSTNIIVEVVSDSAQLAEANTKSLLQNKTLVDLLDKPFADSLDNILQKDIGVGLTQFNQTKPMTVMLTLSMVYIMRDNRALLKAYSGLPLDASFVKDGQSKGKTITALETITAQMDLLFTSRTNEEQVVALKNFIRKIALNISMGNELLKAYLNNDLNELWKIYEQSMELSGEEDYLLKERNNNWMQKLPTLISKQSNFIAVGSLHLAGPDGLIAQLINRGYTITPLKL